MRGKAKMKGWRLDSVLRVREQQAMEPAVRILDA